MIEYVKAGRLTKKIALLRLKLSSEGFFSEMLIRKSSMVNEVVF